MYIPTEASSNVAVHFLLFGKNTDKLSQWSSLIGIVTAIVGNILISFALNIQRYAHIRIDQDYSRKKQERKARKRLPKAIRNYGAAVQQNRIAEERARVNANAPGLDSYTDNDDASSDESESSPLNEDTETASRDQDTETQNEKEKGRKSYLSSPYWWLGISLMAVGEAGNFLAYGFAPASIVSPLGVVALTSNCLIAPLLLKERFRKRDFWGVLVAIGGAVTIVLSARTSEAKMGPDRLWMAIRRWEFLAYVLITLVFIIILMIASPRFGRRTILIDLGLVGLFGGYTALSTKGVAAMISGALFRAFAFPITYVLILVLVGSAIMQIRYINRALSNFNSTQVIPTQFVLFTLSVIVGSAVLYRDFEKTDLEHVIKFVAGCLLTFSGVWLITSGRKNGDDDDDDDDYPEDETIRLIDEEHVSERSGSTKNERSETISTTASTTDAQAITVEDDVSSAAKQTQSIAHTPEASTGTGADLYQPSALHPLRESARPTTPRQGTHLSSISDSTPFFTPSEVPARATRPVGLPSNQSDSALLHPMTPTPQGRISPLRPTLVLPDGEVYRTPPSGILRSARGSIHRLIPAPLISPLPGALNTMVAESLLRGEGSPRFLRDSFRRKRSLRNRTAQSAGQPTVPQSAIESSPISRWTTSDGDVPETPRTTTSDYGDSNNRSGRKRNRLGSFGDTLADFFSKKNKKADRDPEQDGNYPETDLESPSHSRSNR